MTAFDELLEMSTAGLPQDKDVKWTHLSVRQICGGLSEKGFILSAYHVKQMLTLRDYKKRGILKMKTLKEAEGRNEQFENIRSIKADYMNSDGY